MVEDIPDRATTEDFTEEIDEARCVRQNNFFHLLLGVAPFFQLCDHGGIFTILGRDVGLSPDEDRLREDYFYEILAFSRRTINLEFDEETAKPEKATEASRNAGIDPSTMKMKPWYQGHDRASDQKTPTGTDRASYHAREPIEDDDERLTMRQGDMPPPVPERFANPRIREDPAVQDFRQNSEKMHRATSDDAYIKAGFDYCRSVFPQSVRKVSPNVDFYNVSTYQCSILLNNMGSFNKKSEFQKAENIDKPISTNEKFNVTNDPHLSLFPEFWWNDYTHVILTAEADSFPQELLNDYDLVGCLSSRNSPRKN